MVDEAKTSLSEHPKNAAPPNRFDRDAGSAPPSMDYRFPTALHSLLINGRKIMLLAPRDPDSLLNDPIIEARYKADNYLPYWPIIWPTGLILAERILQSPSPIMNDPAAAGRVIELGCGLGLCAVAAALRGWRATATDYDPEAVIFARHNAAINHVRPGRFDAVAMDWRQPLGLKFQWIIASDVLYERRLHPLLLDAIDALLAPGGRVWIADPDRNCALDFPTEAAGRGFRISVDPLVAKQPAMPGQTATLYTLTRQER